MTDAIDSVALRADKIKARLGNVEVLSDVSIDFSRRRWTSIVGPNGAGKSTLLKVLAGLTPFTGSVQLLGQPIQSLPAKQRAQQLSWLGQSSGSFSEASADDLTAYDVTMLGRLPHQPWLAPASADDHAAVEKALRSTHAWDWRGRALGQLSGGERQRVLLARALAVEAEVLLMDEPLANLDPPHQTDWLLTAKSLVASGKTVISVLHEISFALHADELVVMANGRVAYQGASTQAATHRAVENVFNQRVAIHNLADQWVALPKI
ncbi:MAG: ABC transporter ATP-binding protein [Polaromonas sp.]